MKIGIVTLIGFTNNGNRLQNYALQQTLLKTNPNTTIDTIYIDTYKGFIACTKKMILKTFRILKRQSLPQKKRFLTFNRNIKFSKRYSPKFKFEQLVNQYDYFITGSDQVWNMGYYSDEKYYFLDWVPTDKKLSYAASIGNNNLPPERQAKFKNLLSSFNHISVREKQSEDMLKNLGINNVSTHLDPTLLLTSEEWDKVSSKPNYNLAQDYIFVCMLGNITDEYQKKINLLAQMFDLNIINLYDKKNKEIFKSGPSEFIYLIKNAQFVVTDSFHCIAFSIIYNTKFFHFGRTVTNSNDSSANINSRIDNLERVFDTKFMTHKDIENENIENILAFEIKNKDKILNAERERSYKYLNEALSPKTYVNLDDKKFRCTGCGLCANICPQKAIKIVKNEKGFYQYQINKKKCNNCGACLKLCPANKSYDKIDFNNAIILAAKNSTPIKDNSSSAGVFGKIASETLNNGGIVYGLSYNEKNEFSRIVKLENLESIKGSKYYQANLSPSYPMIEKDLEEGKQVLICGTPCQIAGIRQKFKYHNNLTTIGIVCHGTPSKDTLHDYCTETHGGIPTHVNFRKKNPFWQNYSIEFMYNNKSIVEEAFQNDWFKAFISDYFLNNCCYNCHFAGNQYGADIILGDFWGIDKIDPKFYDKYGTSIVIAITDKGKSIVRELKNKIITKQYTNINKIIPYNPCIVRTNYGKQKEYIQELFYINKQNSMTFKKNIELINKSNIVVKKPFIKRALGKIYRIVFNKK